MQSPPFHQPHRLGCWNNKHLGLRNVTWFTENQKMPNSLKRVVLTRAPRFINARHYRPCQFRSGGEATTFPILTRISQPAKGQMTNPFAAVCISIKICACLSYSPLNRFLPCCNRGPPSSRSRRLFHLSAYLASTYGSCCHL